MSRRRVADTPAAGRSRVWSAAHQPVCAQADWYRVTFSTDRATFHRRDGDIETRLEVTVVPDDSAEVRRVTVTNRGVGGPRSRGHELRRDRPHVARRRSPASGVRQPVRGDGVAAGECRDARDAPPAIVDGADGLGRARGGGGRRRRRGCVAAHRARDLRDRSRAIPRPRPGRPASRGARRRGGWPAVRHDGRRPRSGVRASGARTDRVPRNRRKSHSRRSSRRTGTAPSSSPTATTIRTARSARSTSRGCRRRSRCVSWASRPPMRRCTRRSRGICSRRRPPCARRRRSMLQARRGQDALWAHGISGDNPILLAIVDSPAGLPTVRELLAAHHYWRLKGLVIDLVLLQHLPADVSAGAAGCAADAVMASTEGMVLDKPGGVFIRRQDITPADDLATLRAVARVELRCDSGLRLAEILEVPDAPPDYPAPFVPRVSRQRHRDPEHARCSGRPFGGSRPGPAAPRRRPRAVRRPRRRQTDSAPSRLMARTRSCCAKARPRRRRGATSSRTNGRVSSW